MTTATDGGAAFQDRIPDNYCFGCGAENPRGLQIKSRWSASDEAVCVYRPEPHQAAGPRHVLNGGIIATLIDCHSICTAVADAYRREGREPESEPAIWYVTGTLTVRYLAPAPIAEPVTVTAHLGERTERKTLVRCELRSGDTLCAEGEVTAIRVPPQWRQAQGV